MAHDLGRICCEPENAFQDANIKHLTDPGFNFSPAVRSTLTEL